VIVQFQHLSIPETKKEKKNSSRRKKKLKNVEEIENPNRKVTHRQDDGGGRSIGREGKLGRKCRISHRQ